MKDQPNKCEHGYSNTEDMCPNPKCHQPSPLKHEEQDNQDRMNRENQKHNDSMNQSQQEVAKPTVEGWEERLAGMLYDIVKEARTLGPHEMPKKQQPIYDLINSLLSTATTEARKEGEIRALDDIIATAKNLKQFASLSSKEPHEPKA